MKLSDLYINWDNFSMYKKITIHRDNHIVYIGTYADCPRYMDDFEVLSYKHYNGKISIRVR